MKKAANIQSRRNFIKTVSALALFSSFHWVKCKSKSGNFHEKNILSPAQEIIFHSVLLYMWPDNKNIPTVKEIQIPRYIKWYLNDKYIDPEEKQYFFNGLTWIEESALENYGKKFKNLTKSQRYELLDTVKNTGWGESWLSMVMTLVIEAMFADPIYHSNPGGIVWKWLNHDPGQPRPDKHNKYPVILNRKKKTTVITGIDQIL